MLEDICQVFQVCLLIEVSVFDHLVVTFIFHSLKCLLYKVIGQSGRSRLIQDRAWILSVYQISARCGNFVPKTVFSCYAFKTKKYLVDSSRKNNSNIVLRQFPK